MAVPPYELQQLLVALTDVLAQGMPPCLLFAQVDIVPAPLHCLRGLGAITSTLVRPMAEGVAKLSWIEIGLLCETVAASMRAIANSSTFLVLGKESSLIDPSPKRFAFHAQSFDAIDVQLQLQHGAIRGREPGGERLGGAVDEGQDGFSGSPSARPGARSCGWPPGSWNRCCRRGWKPCYSSDQYGFGRKDATNSSNDRAMW